MCLRQRFLGDRRRLFSFVRRPVPTPRSRFFHLRADQSVQLGCGIKLIKVGDGRVSAAVGDDGTSQ